MKLIYTIKKEDVNKLVINVEPCPTCKRTEKVYLSHVIGRILPVDVDKRVYRSNKGIISVENNEQLEKRRNDK